MADELVDLVNEQDEVIGEAMKSEVHAKRLLHRIAVVIVLYHGKILVQKRAATKNGKFDHSVGGHVGRGESYEAAAVREAREEIGLDLDPIFLGKTFGRAKPATDGSVRVSHYYGTFEATIDDAQFQLIKPDPQEVADLVLMSPEEILAKMRAEPDTFTTGFMRTLNLYIEKKGLPLAPVKIPDAKEYS